VTGRRWVAAVFAIALLHVHVTAQIADQVIVYGTSTSLLRFDRRLDLLGVSVIPPGSSGSLEQVCPIAIDGAGRSWVCFAPLGSKTLVRMTSDGVLLPSTLLSHNPVHVTATVDGRLLALTRIPLLSPGPAYGVASDGLVLWSNGAGPAQYTEVYPRFFATTTAGEVWLGDATPPAGKFWMQTLLTRLDPDTGAILDTFQPPDLTNGSSDEILAQLVGAPDGTMWMMRGGAGSSPGWFLENTDGDSILQMFAPVNAGSDTATVAVRIDGAGKVFLVSSVGTFLYRYDPANAASPEATYTMGGIIVGYALGANGDEAYAMIAPLSAPLTRRLERVNLVTGRKSSIPMDAWFNPAIAYGDPTGFIYANVVDRQGDNDGDGVPNGVETAAGSNPFDATSRPDGPKVHVDFAAGSNALILIFQDPDGLLDPVRGLDLSTLSVTIANFGNVFWLLAPFATALDLSADGTTATLTFGGLPLPYGKKWKVEALVADLTGAEGWDWQVTPPGDL
jgi:hypothetical protein